MVNPKLLLLVGAVVLVVSTAIAIFYAVSYTPDTGSRRAPVTSLTSPAPATP